MASAFCQNKYDRRKLLYHPEAIAKLLKDGDCWPVTVNTGFTTYCNHSCTWCSTAYTTRLIPKEKSRDQLIVSPAVWIKNMKILAAGGTKGMIISGQGEPLLHPKATEMLDAVADTEIRYMMFSNGERLGPRHYDALFKSALAIRFSIDAATEELHTKYHAAENSNGRGSADFNKVVANLRELVEEKRRRGSVFPHLGAQMICSKLTESDFEGFAKLFKEVGIDYVVYKSLQRNESNSGITLSSHDIHETEEDRRAQAAKMLKQLLDIKNRYESENFEVHVKADQIEHAYVKQFNGSERYKKCRAHPLTPMMEPDGKVYVCIDHGGNDEFVIGNIYDNDFDEIWASDRRQEVIQNIDLNKKCPAGCFLDEANVILDELAAPLPTHHHQLI